MTKQQTPKIVGFRLECDDPAAFYIAWKTHRFGPRWFSISYEYGASPVRDKRSMLEQIKDMAALGLTYNVFPILRSEVTQ